MQSALCQLPPVFSFVADPKRKKETIKVACNVAPDGKKLLMIAVDVGNASYTGTFDESELGRIKDSSSPWQTFFRDIESAFNSKAIQVNLDGGQCVVAVKNSKFNLPKSADPNGSIKLLEKLYESYKLRTDKETEKQLQDLGKRQEEMRRKVITLENEKEQLKETIALSEQEEKVMMEKYSELQHELSAHSEQYKKACEAQGKKPLTEEEAPIEPDFSTCVGRIPISTADHREYDPMLLKMIKSKFMPAENDEDADRDIDPEKEKYLKIIRPWTTSEYEQQMKALPESQRSYIMKVMEKIDAWDYDVWTIQDMGRGSLFYTAYALFLRWGFLKKFNIDERVFINFVSNVEHGYHPNPYHNSQHGADVQHIVHFILSAGGLKDVGQLTEEDCLAALLAGMIHDYDHPGLNNNFHIKVQSYLAILYNDRSILENHHCAEVFEMMKNPKYNFLNSLNESQRRDVRETVIDMVLSTDMGLHAKIFGTWKKRIATDHELSKRKDDQRLALAMAIKMADISNCGRPEHLYLKWSAKLSEEFFLQGDNERNRGDTVSPFMDRFAPSMAKSQIAFMNYIVIPMFESISEYLPQMHFSVDHCENNKSYWATNDDSL